VPSIQRITSELWGSGPAIAGLSLVAAHVYLAARFLALEHGECNWEADSGRPGDVYLPKQHLTADACWPLMPRSTTGQQAREGLDELLQSGALSDVAGSWLFVGLASEHAERFRDRERKRTKRHASATKVSGGQEQTARREAATTSSRALAFLSWFSQRYQATQGCAYVPSKTKDTACAKRLLAALDRRDLAQRVENFLASDDPWLAKVGKGVGALSSNINKPCVTGVAAPQQGSARVDKSIDNIRRAFADREGPDHTGGGIPIG